MADAPTAAGTPGPTRGQAEATRPPVLTVAVTGSALGGALALALVTGPIRPELFLAAAVAVGVAAVLYLAQPRAGALALILLGSLICVACVAALLSMGTVPWLLTGFWGGAAALLAGLLDLIGRDSADSMIVATVAAVVSLLILSALGLGEYVRVNWTLGERAMLNEIPAEVLGLSDSGAGTKQDYFEQAPQGAWVCRWRLRTSDMTKDWQAMRVAVEHAGWRVLNDTPRETLLAEKSGYALTVTARTEGPTAVKASADSVSSPTSATIDITTSIGAQ